MWKELVNLWKSDNLLDQAYNEAFEMLKIDEEMFLEGVRILRETEAQDIDMEVRKKDKIVNRGERNVRKNILTHLTLTNSADLASSLVLITIVIDIERLGDYAKNLFDLATVHPHVLATGQFTDELKEVENGLKDIFKRSKTCLVSSDEEQALQLLEDYKWINKSCEKFLHSMLTDSSTDYNVKDVAALTLYIRYLKRINSHLRNITSSIVNPFDRIGYKHKKSN
ncbi:MAG: hypothetical protein GF313_09855 [Caldithrix sp.]|nr:hypothetical protein [Caldithrix sp.]